jgi:WD repeat-containing protein 23
VYTGSADGIVKIFNIDATQASQIDVHTATKVVRPDKSGQRSRYNSLFYRFPRERTCVRDVSWHPSAPVFAATSFQGDSVGKGTVSVHSWRGADKDVDSDDNEEDAEYEREEYTPRVYGTQMEEIREDDEGAY